MARYPEDLSLVMKVISYTEETRRRFDQKVTYFSTTAQWMIEKQIAQQMKFESN